MHYFGLAGLILVQGFHAPQLWRLWNRYRTGSQLGDVSIPAYSILLAGLLSYLVYGVSIGAGYYIAGSAIGVVQVGATLWLLVKARGDQ